MLLMFSDPAMATLYYSSLARTPKKTLQLSCSSTPSTSPSCSRNASPTTTVSELSGDSGVGSEEELSCPPLFSPDLHHGDSEDEDPLYENLGDTLYENIHFSSSTSSLPPPLAFSDAMFSSPNQRSSKGSNHRRKVDDGEGEVREEEEEPPFSLMLSSQNPVRIDVRTLRKNKVSGWRRGEYI